MYPLQLCSLTVSLPSDPTFTAENVLEMTREVDAELLAFILHLPGSKKEEIANQYPSREQCREATVAHVLLTHPCPSWRGLSRRLQEFGHEFSEHSAAVVAAAVEVSRKYVKGEEHSNPPLIIPLYHYYSTVFICGSLPFILVFHLILVLGISCH